MRFSQTDFGDLKQIMADAAAIEIMPRFRQLGSDGARQKSSAIDLVTDADEQAEWRMRDAVARRFPKALFVGEESVARDAALLDRIGSADMAIIIDPVDGTSNFAWGLPLFGVLCAVVIKGETVAGMIYDPVGKDWFVARRGEGAEGISATGVSRALKAAAPLPINEQIGISSWYLMDEPERSRVAANLARTRASFAYRCAAHEYRLLIEGHCHYALYWKLMPWDHAAGLLIHAEAGGYSALLDGSPYSPAKHHGGVLAAPDKASWTELYAALMHKA